MKSTNMPKLPKDGLQMIVSYACIINNYITTMKKENALTNFPVAGSCDVKEQI